MATAVLTGPDRGTETCCPGQANTGPYDKRDRSGENVLDILALSLNLETVHVYAELTDPYGLIRRYSGYCSRSTVGEQQTFRFSSLKERAGVKRGFGLQFRLRCGLCRA
jgi:hypothetical protein